MLAGEISATPTFIKSLTEIELITAEAQWLSETFFDLSSGRSGGGFGLSPLSWLDFDAYCRMRKLDLGRWHIDLLRVLDSIFCKHANKAKER